MRILHVTCSARPEYQTGVAQVVHQIVKEQQLLGHKVEVFTLVNHPFLPCYAEETISYEGYRVHRINLVGSTGYSEQAYTDKDYNNSNSISFLERCLRQFQPEVVHFHAIQEMGANMLKVAKCMGTKVVVTMHDWWWLTPCFFLADAQHHPCEQVKIDVSRCNQCIHMVDEDFLAERQVYLKQILLENTDAIITVSEYLKCYLLANGLPEDKIYVNPNGVECPNMLGRKESVPLIFGFMGGRQELKGYQKLIDAFLQLPSDTWQLHIYGCITADKQGAKKVLTYIKALRFKELIAKLSSALQMRLKRHPQIKYYPVFEAEQKDEIYNQVNVLISLSQCKESSSLVVREALIRDIPVITTPSGGPQEVVISGINGFVLKDYQVDSLVEVLKYFLEDQGYHELKQKMKAVPYRYTYKKQVEELEAIYQNMVGKEGIV